MDDYFLPTYKFAIDFSLSRFGNINIFELLCTPNYWVSQFMAKLNRSVTIVLIQRPFRGILWREATLIKSTKYGEIFSKKFSDCLNLHVKKLQKGKNIWFNLFTTWDNKKREPKEKGKRNLSKQLVIWIFESSSYNMTNLEGERQMPMGLTEEELKRKTIVKV